MRAYRVPRKRYVVLLFLIGAAAVQAAVEWDRLRRLTTVVYELIDAAVNNRIIYSETKVESHLAPIRREIANLNKKFNSRPLCSCRGNVTGNSGNRPPRRTEPFHWPPRGE